MSRIIERIYISNESEVEKKAEHKKEEADVIVVMKSGEKFHASFFSFDSLEDLRKKYSQNGEFLNGAYFWSKRIILIDDCSRKLIEKVVEDLVEEGEFGGSFWEDVR